MKRNYKLCFINDQNKRHTTYLKRKNGLIRKAMQLSIFCGVEIFLVIYDKERKRYSQY